MKALGVYVCFAAASAAAAGLAPEDEKALMGRANEYLRSAQQGDAEKFLRLTHPALHGLFGGKEPFEAATRAALKALAGKPAMTAATFGRVVGPLRVGDEELCFLPTSVSARIGNQATEMNSYYIAVRSVGSAEWRFIDAAGLRKRPEVLWQLFPGLPKDVALPRNEVTVKTAK
jgi:hypothetical protein